LHSFPTRRASDLSMLLPFRSSTLITVFMGVLMSRITTSSSITSNPEVRVERFRSQLSQVVIKQPDDSPAVVGLQPPSPLVQVQVMLPFWKLMKFPFSSTP